MNTLWNLRSFELPALADHTNIVGNAQTELMESRSTFVASSERIVLLVIVGKTSFAGCCEGVFGLLVLPNHLLLYVLVIVLDILKGFESFVLLEARSHFEIAQNIEAVIVKAESQILFH